MSEEYIEVMSRMLGREYTDQDLRRAICVGCPSLENGTTLMNLETQEYLYCARDGYPMARYRTGYSGICPYKGEEI
jgi:hypothetical protein